jgi:hypothetical protein
VVVSGSSPSCRARHSPPRWVCAGEAMGQSASDVGDRRSRAEVLDTAERGSARGAYPAAQAQTSLYEGLNGVERDVSQPPVRLDTTAAQEGDPLAHAYDHDSLDVGIASPTTVLHTDVDLVDSSSSDTGSLGETSAATSIEVVVGELGRGLHSFTSQLNLSDVYGIGGARKGCVARDKGVLGVCRVFSCVRHGSS